MAFFAPEELHFDDVVVRCWRPGDGPAFAESVRLSYDHLSPWMAWAKADVTDEDGEDYARRCHAKYLSNEDFPMGIWRSNQVIGGTGFHLRRGSLDSGCAELGMWIAGSVAGQGLGSRVLENLLAWSFTEWPWHRLEWRCDPVNVASWKVAERNGLHLEGTLRDNILQAGVRRSTRVYSLLRPEWHARPA